MNASDKLVDLRAERDHELEAYKNGVVKRMITTLRDVHSDIRAQLGGDLTEFGEARLESMLQRVESLIAQAYISIEADLDAELLQLTADEIATIQAHMTQVLGSELSTVPAVQSVYAATVSRPFQGALLRDWYKTQEEASKRLIRRAITLGIVEGETISQIVARVREAGLTNEHNLAAIVRTAVNHVTTFGRHQFYLDNADLIKGWYFSATLDSKTTPICRKLDSERKIYPVGEGPKPPQHIGCRSADIPILKSNIDGVPEGLRSSIDGEVPADLTYNDFLKRKMYGGDGIKQDRAFVRNVLGASRYELFKDGKLPVTKFVNRRGVTLTLDELRRRHPEAWKTAFGSSKQDAWRTAIGQG